MRMFQGLMLMMAVAAMLPAGENPLYGKWRTGRVSSIQYQQYGTGRAAPTNGETFGFEFNPDGTYSFTGLLQFVMYNCTTATFSHESGRYTIDGDRISLKPESNPYKMTNSCAPSTNKEAPGKLIPRTYRFAANATMLELTGEDGKSQKWQRSQ